MNIGYDEMVTINQLFNTVADIAQDHPATSAPPASNGRQGSWAPSWEKTYAWVERQVMRNALKAA